MDRPSTGQSPRRRLLRPMSLLAATRTGRRAITLTVPAAEGAPEKHPTPSTSQVSRPIFGSGTGSPSQRSAPVLAKDGYTGVQVAPPQNSLKRTELGNGSDTILHPWWEVYQPVDLRPDQPDGQ